MEQTLIAMKENKKQVKESLVSISFYEYKGDCGNICTKKDFYMSKG